DGAGFLACLFGGTDMGEPAPTELWWDGAFFCPNRLGGCYNMEELTPTLISNLIFN
ncbi:MAG: hypothetical protein RLZZ338_3528, partial [Cyanobacteriota bacterium]